VSPPPARAALLLGLVLAWFSLPPLSPAPTATPDLVPEGVAGLLYGAALDLNRATADHLEVLPGIGPARARAILIARADRPFCRVEELVRVPGIGPATLGRVAPQLSVAEGICPAR